jgi:hypothetical protein
MDAVTPDLLERLISLLGKPVSDSSYLSLLTEFGPPRCVDGEFELVEEGISLYVELARISRVIFWLGSCESIPAYQRRLPMGIEAMDKREDVERKVGKTPTSFSRNTETYELGSLAMTVYFDPDDKMYQIILKFIGVFADVSVLSKSYLLETKGIPRFKLFDRGIEIPDFYGLALSTADDEQHVIELEVFEEIDQRTELYCHYWIREVPPGPKGGAEVTAKFELLIDGNIEVTAIDQKSGKVLPVTTDRPSPYATLL